MNSIHGFAVTGPLARYQRPSVAEIAIVILYLIVWLLPVIASWAVAAFGLRFSYVAPHWQNQNADIVVVCVLVAFASGIVAAVVTLFYLNKYPKHQRSSILMCRMNGAQRFFLFAVLLIAAVGLFKSFGGTMFEKGYGGPTVVWLGYGAWSVTFLLALHLLVGDRLASRPFRPLRLLEIIVLSAIFLPFLLSGSRIDFLSFMLALAAYMLILYDAKFKIRVWGALAILAWAGIVANLIGKVRYSGHDPALMFDMAKPAFDPALIFGMAKPEKVEDGMVYLSTIGDIGVSVFQVVGLVQEQAHYVVGMGTALLSYAMRLLPGPFYTNRPGDFWTQLPESIGGGALHSLGEGYLIFGIGGCALMGAVFGMLIAVSIFAGNHFRSTRAPLSWIVFSLPWLLLIRGGWYQFFALLKTIEILVLLLLLLMAVGWVAEKYSTAGGKDHICR